MLHNLSKDPLIPFIATVVSFKDQQEQVEGLGWGYRYKIAVMGDYSSNQSDIPNSKIDYGYCIVPTTAGSGAGNFGKSVQHQYLFVLVGMPQLHQQYWQ